MWLTVHEKQIKLQIIAKPNAKTSTIINITESALHIAIHAKPHKGEANKELIRFISKVFGVPKSQVTLKSGEGSRYKQILMPLTASVQKIIDNPSLLVQ